MGLWSDALEQLDLEGQAELGGERAHPRSCCLRAQLWCEGPMWRTHSVFLCFTWQAHLCPFWGRNRGICCWAKGAGEGPPRGHLVALGAGCGCSLPSSLYRGSGWYFLLKWQNLGTSLQKATCVEIGEFGAYIPLYSPPVDALLYLLI